MSDHKSNPLLHWRRSSGVLDTEAYDCYGRLIAPGDLIQVAGSDIRYEVQSAKVDLTPRMITGVPAAARLVTLVIAHVNTATVPGGVPTMELLKVLDLEERPEAARARFVAEKGPVIQ